MTDTTTSSGVNPPVEKNEFFYHGDHLGSSNMITDSYGAVYQHLEYFPYGETWIEEGGSYGGNTPGYKFTGKELDPETGLYYYGARYYDPVLSKWISADPILAAYLPAGNKQQDENLRGRGGVFNPVNLNLYHYVENNPVRLIDPNGKEGIEGAEPYAQMNSSSEKAVQGAAISFGTQATQDAVARKPYVEGAAKLQRGDPGASQMRDQLKAEARAVSSPTGRAIAEAMDARPPGGGRVNVTNPNVNAAMNVAGKAGPALMVVGGGMSVYNVATAPAGQEARALAREGGTWLGALSFGTAAGWGGVIVGGACCGPPGAVIGGVTFSIIGGAGGGYAGNQAGENIYGAIYGGP